MRHEPMHIETDVLIVGCRRRRHVCRDLGGARRGGGPAG